MYFMTFAGLFFLFVFFLFWPSRLSHTTGQKGLAVLIFEKKHLAAYKLSFFQSLSEKQAAMNH